MLFMIFTAAADDELESIVESAFENVEQGMQFKISSPYSLVVIYNHQMYCFHSLNT